MDEQLDDVAEQRVGLRRALSDGQNAREDTWHRHDRAADFAVRRITQEDQKVKAFVREDGEGVGRVDRQGRQRGEDVAIEAGGEFGSVNLVQLFARFEDDALGGQRGQELVLPASLFGVHERACLGEDFGQELPGGGMAGGFLLLHDARHPDLEELIQVGAGDREEADAFEQGDAFVFGEFEDPSVEIEPAEFAVEHGEYDWASTHGDADDSIRFRRFRAGKQMPCQECYNMTFRRRPASKTPLIPHDSPSGA